MNITMITRKSDLTFHRDSIQALFHASFGQRSMGAVWDWAYLQNPGGEPIVALCHDEGLLVGHYAIVPMPVVGGQGHSRAYLSMTTMVADSHRGCGLFTTLAEQTYAVATDLGVSFVMGFPNDQSTPGFRKKLAWTLPESDAVITVDRVGLQELLEVGALAKSDRMSLDMNTPSVAAWRMSKPGTEYQFQDGLLFKRYQNSIDVLWWRHHDCILSLPSAASYNLLVSSEYVNPHSVAFAYQFGGRGLASDFSPQMVCREMALSDVF